ncbi:hypothetical protein YIM730264_07570 [Thermus hydrothermalis]
MGATAPPSRGTPILPQAKALRKSLTLQDRNPPERPPGEEKTLCTGGRKPGLKGPKRRGEAGAKGKARPPPSRAFQGGYRAV